MTQPVPVQSPEQPPTVCPVCHTWTMMPYASRHTTPIPPPEALGIMVVGAWLVLRGAKEADLCPQHKEMVIRLDVQKHTREEFERSEQARIAAEAAIPKYPTPQHEGIASQLIGRIAQVNAPQVVNRVVAPTAQPVLTADPNSFPCPDCKKPIRNGEVHACTGEP